MKVTSVDNIDQKVLDVLAAKYKDDPNIRLLDERKTLSSGKPREYFLISQDRSSLGGDDIEWSFIWIGSNLWQFRYLNTKCHVKSLWKDPLTLLNSLL